MNAAQQYRWFYKPLAFIACALPAALMLAAVFGHGPMDLGVDPARRLEHACGKTALNILLITLAITPVRRLTGLQDLLRLRRLLGLFAFFYALLHFVVYAWLDQDLDLHAIGEDIVKRPYITIGLAALLMMMPLAVTSTNRMMRRLGRHWTKLHQLVYVIALLGVWHFWWQVKRDIREPLLYAGMLAVLLGWRLTVKFWPARVPGRT